MAASTDGKPQTGWALSPEVGRPHEAVVELAQPATAVGGVRLKLTLDFQFGQQHQLGRFRLSVTDAREPMGLKGLPPPIRAILDVAPEARKAQQRADLRTHYRSQVSPEMKPITAKLA